MEMQELEITIGKDGTVQVAVRGIRGDGCLGLTKNLEESVGVVEQRDYSAEYYEQAEQVSSWEENKTR